MAEKLTRPRAARTPGPDGRPPDGAPKPGGRGAVSRLYTVLGGTGFLGSSVAWHLLDDGHRVRVAARNARQAANVPDSARAEAVDADLFEPATLSAALRGADGAVNATSLYLEEGDVTFESVHVEGAARLAGLARAAGMRRFVHVSGIGSHPEADDPYIRARGQGEDAVRSAFPGATIVRPGAMFGPGDALLEAIVRTARLPFYPLFGQGETRLQPVHVDDVARAIARILQADDPAPTYELAGPRVYSYRELVRAIAEATGQTVRPVTVPFPLWHGVALAAERLPGAPLTRSQVALVERDNVADEGMPGLQELGLTPLDIVDYARRERGAGADTQTDGSTT